MAETMIRTLCVYCGSNVGISPEYRMGAERLAQAMAELGMDLVYGAGNVGMMGVIADAVIARGRRATGIIPRRLRELELAHTDLHELVEVETMRERKALMIEKGDAFVALPGGIGTLEELTEVMTLTQLGYIAKPIGLLDSGGFWKPFMVFLDHLVREGFLKQAQKDQLVVDDDPFRLLDRLGKAPTIYVPKWN